MLHHNNYNHLTAKVRESLSYPAKIVLNRKLLHGDVLDFGCGFGKDVEILREQGIRIVGYDKHYFPEYPTRKFDTILCFYVLNVLTQEEQASVLMEISQLLKPSGTAYFAVRRDIRSDGYRIHKIHQKPTYQCTVKLSYPSVFVNDSCEIYAYRHYNRSAHREHTDCPFCNPDSERELIVESATAYTIFDKYPVSEGHALILPKTHCSNYHHLSFKEQSACWYMLNTVEGILRKRFSPEGFNIGINVGEVAGQTIPHAHIHVIPRYSGDVEDPRGGVRGVLPEKQKW